MKETSHCIYWYAIYGKNRLQYLKIKLQKLKFTSPAMGLWLASLVKIFAILYFFSYFKP